MNSFKLLDDCLERFMELAKKHNVNSKAKKLASGVNQALAEQAKSHGIVMLPHKHKYIHVDVPENLKASAADGFSIIEKRWSRTAFKSDYKIWLTKFVEVLKKVKVEAPWLDTKALLTPFLTVTWDDATPFEELTKEKKFFLILDQTKKHFIKNHADLTKAFQVLDMDAYEFMDEFKRLFEARKLTYQDLEAFEKAQIFPDSWIRRSIGAKEYCDRFPSGKHSTKDICKDVYSALASLKVGESDLF